MGFDTHIGNHYPFTLADKLKVITEPSPWYMRESGAESPWGRRMIPTEMISGGVICHRETPQDTAPLQCRCLRRFRHPGQPVRISVAPSLAAATITARREKNEPGRSQRATPCARVEICRPNRGDRCPAPGAAQCIRKAALGRGAPCRRATDSPV